MINSKNNIGSDLINLMRADQKQANSMRKLASGRQLNSFSDNPAAASISVKMRSQIGAVNQEIMNTETNISLLQTKEAGLGEVQNNFEAIKSLQQSASNPAYGQEEKAAIQNQIDSIVQSTKNTLETTTFNGKEVITAGENLKSALEDGVSLDDLSSTDSVLNEISTERSNTGSQVNAMGSDVRSKLVQMEELTRAESVIGDTDMAKEMMNKVSAELQRATATSLLKSSFALQGNAIASLLGK